jgi:hypothetical protein
MRKLAIAFAAAGLCALALMFNNIVPVTAQVPALPVPPYNQDIGAVLTLTRGPGSAGQGSNTSAQISTAAQNNLAFRGAVCTYAQTASSGAASTTFVIQGFDAATATWNTLVSSAAISGPTVSAPFMIAAGPGLIAGDAPTNGVQKAVMLPRTWRVGVTVAGTNSVDASIGCNLIRG